jgi:hypothetical protein
MRVVRTVVAVVVATSIAVTGCTARTNADQPSPPPTHRTDPTPLDRQASIYAAVLRQYLTSGGGHDGGDAGFGGFRFPHIFVLDHTVVPGADPFGQSGSGSGPIPAAVRRAVTRSLADVGLLSFVPSGKAVIVRGSCGEVLDRGILITLGPVDGVGDRVQVGIYGHVSCVATSSLAYWVGRTGGGWRVAGVAWRGPVA